ncbi:MAG TPA: MFS transporter [Candidatus Limnocylindrales bacterium]|nr:MFS transporter [Candidatus Limnocylindrales bacterium]
MASPPVSPEEISRKRSAAVAIFGAFIVAGVVTTLLGPILPVLISRWSLSDERAGLFFTFQFGTSMAGVASVSLLISRWGYKVAFVCGYSAVALGIAGLTSSSQAACFCATALFGYGLGLVLPSSNLWVAEVTRSTRVAALSVLNLTWGIGAIACSPLILAAQSAHAISAFLYAVAALAMIAALILAVFPLEPDSLANPAAEEKSAVASGPTAAIALGALFFLYVGVENSLGGWAAALAKRMPATPHNLWALAPMFFWGGLMTGRALVPMISLRKKERLLVALGLLLGLAACVGLLRVRTFWGAAVSVALAGVGFAAIYPVLVTWMAKHFGDRARRIGSLMFALAGMGGAVAPWLVGFVSTREGSLRAGLLVPVVSCLLMLALLGLIPHRVAD